MTRKDFNLIATAMKQALQEDPNSVRNACHCLAEHLRDTNPAFDFQRFLAACGALNTGLSRVEPLLDRG